MLSFSPLYWVYHDNWQFDETIMVRNAQGGLGRFGFKIKELC